MSVGRVVLGRVLCGAYCLGARSLGQVVLVPFQSHYFDPLVTKLSSV